MRKLTGYAAAVVGVVGVVMSLYHVYARLTPAAPDGLVLRIIALAFCLVLAFLLFPLPPRTPLDEESTRLDDAAPVGATDASRGSTWGWPASRSPCLSYLFIYYGYITERFPTAHPLSAMDIAWAPSSCCSCSRPPAARSGLALPGARARVHRLRAGRAVAARDRSATRA